MQKYLNNIKILLIMNKKGFSKWLIFLVLLAMFIGAYIIFKKYGLVYLQKIIPDEFEGNILDIIIFIVIITLNYFFVKFSSSILQSYLLTKGDKREVKLFISVYKYFLWFSVIFISLALLFKQIGSLITSLGLIGFGVTLALQKPILNFVGWLTIVFSKSYKIGDIININNINGQVYDVTIMYTSLAELNQDGDATGKSVSVPNEFILTSAVINYSKGTNNIWDTITIYLTYKSNWKKARTIVEKLVQETISKDSKQGINDLLKKGVKKAQKVIVRVNLNEKGIVLKFMYFIDFGIANDVKTELTSKILETLSKHKDIQFGKTENV